MKKKTLRDEFAMAALVGLLAGCKPAKDKKGYLIHVRTMACSYEIADAMLAERGK